MKKILHHANNGRLFLQEYLSKRFLEGNSSSTLHYTRTPTYVIGFSPWKKYLTNWFPERELIFLPRLIGIFEFKKYYWQHILEDKRAEVFIWGIKVKPKILHLLRQNNIKCHHVEDGFLRSVELGSTKAPPYSLTIDSKTPYFDATKPSDLEELLANYDFENDNDLLTEANLIISRIIKNGISKYNNSTPVNINDLYGNKVKKRVLVIGQVEDDASIKLGCEQKLTNNDVVKLAAAENPNAQIIYKPHPDVLHRYRKRGSNPKYVKNICTVIEEDVPIAQALETIDHVYTITSLAGFEALIRGIKVTTLGCPFYGGWGATDTRQPNTRRTRKLNAQEIFSGAYLLYAKYFDPDAKSPITIMETIEKLEKARERNESSKCRNT